MPAMPTSAVNTKPIPAIPGRPDAAKASSNDPQSFGSVDDAFWRLSTLTGILVAFPLRTELRQRTHCRSSRRDSGISLATITVAPLRGALIAVLLQWRGGCDILDPQRDRVRNVRSY